MVGGRTKLVSDITIGELQLLDNNLFKLGKWEGRTFKWVYENRYPYYLFLKKLTNANEQFQIFVYYCEILDRVKSI